SSSRGRRRSGSSRSRQRRVPAAQWALRRRAARAREADEGGAVRARQRAGCRETLEDVEVGARARADGAPGLLGRADSAEGMTMKRTSVAVAAGLAGGAVGLLAMKYAMQGTKNLMG